MLFDPSLSITDRETQLSYQVEWINKSILTIDVKETYMKLQTPFDPTNTGGITLPSGEKFNWKEIGITYISDIRKLFNFLISSRYGGYFDGTRLTMNGELYYRVQPYGSIAIVTTYNNFFLLDPDLILHLQKNFSSPVLFSIITR
jgi:hypothetical protein